jgi:hypothetical protein
MSESPTNVGLEWIKSSFSISTGACVELALAGAFIALRDSKAPAVAPFLFTHQEFAAFLRGAKQGEFDRLLDDA